jgi:demethylmenaquinone methyltransferase/2-methoxy-6-polyprenyl-1,4-benzoquinol methylase
MLSIARQKVQGLPVELQSGDVDAMEFENRFDIVTVAFGFRNFPDRRHSLETMTRALKPGGRLVILELVPSQGLLKRVISLYEQRVIPLIGRLVSRDAMAYSYLPQSVAASTTAPEIRELMLGAGLGEIAVRVLNFGTVAVVRGRKAR